jgi:hypothetical protein
LLCRSFPLVPALLPLCLLPHLLHLLGFFP